MDRSKTSWEQGTSVFGHADSRFGGLQFKALEPTPSTTANGQIKRLLLNNVATMEVNGGMVPHEWISER